MQIGFLARDRAAHFGRIGVRWSRAACSRPFVGWLLVALLTACDSSPRDHADAVSARPDAEADLGDGGDRALRDARSANRVAANPRDTDADGGTSRPTDAGTSRATDAGEEGALDAGASAGEAGTLDGGSAVDAQAMDSSAAVEPQPAGYGLDSRPSNTSCAIVDRLPSLLSQTGCFEPATPWVPVTGLIAYSVNQPLWSDGASKQRFMALPDGARLAVDTATGDYDVPVGSVLIKEFSLDGKRIETRFIVRADSDQWRVGAYIWHADGMDATLGSGDVEVGSVAWKVPSSNECNKCHTRGAGFTLGLEQAQLDGSFTYPSTGRTTNQVDTLIHIGVLDGRADIEPLPALDGSAPAQARARAYLHANCSGCHRPSETAKFDARWTTPFAEQGLCDKAPTANNFGSSDYRLIKPGAPMQSIVRLRMASTDSNLRMPPLGRVLVHDAAVAVMDQWIGGLAACP